MAFKKCPKCSKKTAVKNWIKRGKQSYKCKSCNHRFQNKKRKMRTSNKLRDEYSFGKQTYKQLWKKYWCSKKTIQRKLDLQKNTGHIFYNHNLLPRHTYIIMDASV